LERIVERVRRDDPRAARALANRIFERCTSLQTVSNRGRMGRIADTRELVLAPLPYIIVYRVKPDTVEFVRIYHGAQNWP
jgi:toxin ParE1/3/4